MADSRAALVALAADINRAVELLDRLAPAVEAYRSGSSPEPAPQAKKKPGPPRLPPAERQKRRRETQAAWREKQKAGRMPLGQRQPSTDAKRPSEAATTQEPQEGPSESEADAPPDHPPESAVAQHAPEPAERAAVSSQPPTKTNGRSPDSIAGRKSGPLSKEELLASCATFAALAPSEQADIEFAASGLRNAKPEQIERRLAKLAPGRRTDALLEVLQHDGCFR